METFSHLRGVWLRAAFFLLFHLPRAGCEEGEEREALPNSGLPVFGLEDLKSGEPDLRREGRGGFCAGSLSCLRNGAEKSAPATRASSLLPPRRARAPPIETARRKPGSAGSPRGRVREARFAPRGSCP